MAFVGLMPFFFLLFLSSLRCRGAVIELGELLAIAR